MYADATHVHVLDAEDFNQYSLPLEDVQQEMGFVTTELEGMLALIYNDECVGLQLPTAVELDIVECDPGIRGNSATGRTKPAKLETGLVVQVPEYLKQGERIKVDTRTGEFLSRAWPARQLRHTAPIPPALRRSLRRLTAVVSRPRCTIACSSGNSPARQLGIHQFAIDGQFETAAAGWLQLEALLIAACTA